MNQNNQNYESRGVSLTPAQWERCDRLTDEYGKRSRNAFIREAVDFYCAWLEKEHMERFLLPSVGDGLKDQGQRRENPKR